LCLATGALHLSAGELLRQEAAKPDSKVGQLINEHIHAGKIVPVDVTVQLLLAEMEKSSATRVLVDGFPRNMDNLQGWDRVVGSKVSVTGVLFLDAPEDVMVARLLSRARNDDAPDTIRKRLATFRNETVPVLKCFQGVTTVRADRPIEAVFSEIVASDLWSRAIPRSAAAAGAVGGGGGLAGRSFGVRARWLAATTAVGIVGLRVWRG
jgi:UMP-CMP kinase